MRYRTMLLLAVSVVTAAFLILNWRVLAAPASFSFLIASIDIPIGVVVLGLLALISLAFAIYVAIWQNALLLDFRRQSKELQSQRQLAENSEASRFTELTTLIHGELAALRERMEAALAALRDEVRDTEHSIAATLGEIDDRMQRGASRAVDS